MALDYVALRNTLDTPIAGHNASYQNQVFKQQYGQALGNDAYTALQSDLRNYLTAAKNGNVNLNDQNKKRYEASVDSYITSLTDINKYITTDTSYKNLSDTYKKLADSYISKKSNTVSSSDFREVTAADITKYAPKAYTAAAIQSTSRLDSNQLSDFFKTTMTAGSQDQYRSALADRLTSLYSGAGLSNISEGQVLGGDARFEENNLKQTLINLSSDLKDLQLTTASDRTASSLASVIDSSVSSGMVSNELANFFGLRGTDSTTNSQNLVSVFDTYNKSLSTQNKEAEAKAEAERQALEAEQARIAKEQAIDAKQKDLLKRGVNPLSAFLQLSQSLRGNTLGSSDEASSSDSTLGNTGIYGK